MSSLWLNGTEAAAVGSFTFERSEPSFTPWQTEGASACHGEAPGVDIQAMRAEAFAQGWDEGRRTVELEFAAERDALARLAEGLEVLRPEPTGALAMLLAETVHRLVRQIVGAADVVDPDLLAARAEAAAALIGNETAPARLRLNPDDLPLLDTGRFPLPLLPDPSLARGAVVLDTGRGWIEDGPAVRLERLRAELDRMSETR